ncbi:NAD(P)-dependent glycerol-3-phosphate dehydrogenase [Erysipelothrix sp. HDW6B]|uniref:NAD(P)H-dependent glycerol-3-phosphate dehydrogenase n=1 Tax=Erysipelothrix sp. HDW6B TaxID=2714929 RepID=UPI0014085F72|nr:NAD(P)H-dependent glycerol-3-phosphate dehydrogenase [Erysipelothrix sp. HDW6B]QIK86114.1 NAD(P)-dependent glycerol-3-phosphate dehydrogenase [Erysipelothrix sp. HDW6B]
MKIGIIGSGSWGTALGQVLADNQHEVLIWGRKLDEVVDIHLYSQNETYFPGIKLNESLDATQDFEEVVNADVVLLAVPTGAVEEVAKRLNETLTRPVTIINVAKGFHPETHELLIDVIERVVDAEKRLGVVSLIGPSHAEEVVLRDLTTINAVSLNQNAAELVQNLFSNDYFRVYTNNDVIGAQVGVAIKNIIAIASGCLQGLDYGDNARAALMTRGLAEMTRFGVALGGEAETFLGLCGVGDLIVTATSQHSRNFQAGFMIGKNNSAQAFFDTNDKTVEGVFAAKVVHNMAKSMNVSMPITEEVYKVVFEGKEPVTAIRELMQRDLKAE